MQGGGSFDLEPEDATTTTAGLVFQFGGAAQGLQISADWYEVKIEEAITSPNANQLAQNCFEHDTFCDRINNGVDPDTIGGAITFVDTTALNLNRFITRGIDFETRLQPAAGAARRRAQIPAGRLLSLRLPGRRRELGRPDGPDGLLRRFQHVAALAGERVGQLCARTVHRHRAAAPDRFGQLQCDLHRPGQLELRSISVRTASTTIRCRPRLT